MIGRVVGNFEFQALLGEGGIGAVYAAVDRMLGRPVAIKLLHPELAHDTRFVDRFRGEASSLARLNHPNITTLYSLHSEGQELLMIIELVDGRTLEDILRASGRLAADECLAVASQATEGFAYAHRMGVVHRDIKPANLMVTGDGSLKIMDFGIARIRGSQRMTRTGHIIGTLAYMAPEQIQGHEGDERSDIYSLGIVLYELLTGDPPFLADSEYQLIRAQVEERPRGLAERLPGIDPAIDRAVMRALAKDPGERFPSMPDLARALGSTMGLTTARETMIRRVAPLVSQLAATRQWQIPAGRPASAASAAAPAAMTPAPLPGPSQTPAPPSVKPDGKRRISVPVLLLGGAILAFIAGMGYLFKDTFFAAKAPPQLVTPAEPPAPALGGPVAEPAPSQPPASAVTSTEGAGNQPATSPPPALPTPAPAPAPEPSPGPEPSPAAPVTVEPPETPRETPPAPFAPTIPMTPVAPGKQPPAIGSIEPMQPVDETPAKPDKPEKKSKKETKPQPKKSQPVARSGESGGGSSSSHGGSGGGTSSGSAGGGGGSSGGSSSGGGGSGGGSWGRNKLAPPAQTGSSGWSIQRN